mmetsp:Transcript_5813/g.8925  ORF Transcript_5813/g.8925 Transcript_5813/m.8925 type:complete len:225 (+) Transcript_5813:103-777(+)
MNGEDIPYKVLIAAGLIFDLVTAMIGLLTLIGTENRIECCGEYIDVPEFFIWLCVFEIGMVFVEAFPAIFCFLQVLTILNPWCGLAITAGLVYSSNRTEVIATLVFEILAFFTDGIALTVNPHPCASSLFCIERCTSLIPLGLTLLIVINYLNQGGECVTSDKFSMNATFSISIQRSDGTDDCRLCMADGLPWNHSCASNVGDTLGFYYGTSCSGEPKFCWFEY